MPSRKKAFFYPGAPQFVQFPPIGPSQGGGGYVFTNAEAAAVAASFTTPPTDARKALIDEVWTTIKAASIPATLDRLFILAAADNQAARVDWLGGPSLTAINGPTFTADRGFQGDGSGSYLNTQYNPATGGNKFNTVSAHYSLWSRTVAGNTGNNGNIGGTGNTHMVPRNGTDQFGYRIACTTQVLVANTDGSGLFTANRSGAANTEAYRNGALLQSDTPGNGTITSSMMFVGALSNAGTPQNFSVSQFSAIATGGKLTAGQVLALYNALNTYLQAVGAA